LPPDGKLADRTAVAQGTGSVLPARNVTHPQRSPDCGIEPQDGQE
jgi:hypothetical protein